MARDLDELIDEARRQEPASAADRTRVRAGLDRQLASTPATNVALSSKTLPLVGASILGIGAVVALVVAVRSGPSSELQAPVSTVQVVEQAPVQAPGSGLLAPGARPAEVGAAPAVSESSSQAQPAPRRLVIPRSPPQARSTKQPALLSLTEESRALARVNQLLRASNATSALALLDEQDREFASGGLVAERAAARVLALCGAGRASEAKQRADAFLREHPASPLRARVLGSCAGSP